MFSLFNIAATVAILSKDEQAEHAIAFQKTGDQRHIDALIRANVRLAIKIAKKCQRSHIEMDDLLTEALTGIMRAAETFDPESGASFSTYASQWMRSRVQEFVQANTGAVRCGSRTAKALWASLARVRRQHGLDVTPEVIASELGLSVEEVKEILPLLNGSVTSMEAPVRDEDGATFGDTLQSGSLGQDVAYDRTMASQEILCAMSDFADTLNDRHGDVFRRRILADYLGTSKASPCDFGVTKQRISQIEKSVIGKLQVFLTNRFGDDLKEMMG